ncbi:FAD-dependent monooxygenase [Micromonospora sp. DPT]|uniref:FAD-dependent monooxygenase n=1 Tax=Micromonospora sp. DPT TaxID=3142975 RepID=UPI003207EC5A
MSDHETDDGVLVVGAGPAGLTATAELLRRGVPVHCVDRASGPSGLSKALGVWPRTVELFHRLGGARHVAAEALPQAAMRYYSSGRLVADIRFRRPTHQPMAFPQPAVESLLREAVERLGGSVSWETTLLSLAQDAGGVTARLREPDGTVVARRYRYAVGADGAGSRVREELGVSFEGATHELGFVVADIAMDTTLQHDVTHYFCSDKGILVTCGLPDGRWRVFTSGPPGMSRDEVDLSLVQRLVDERGPGGLRLRDPEWISVFAVHARHADRMRVGRVFLVGDAAHIHSPAGGQGLNTGVTDAHNLAWKLALAWRGRCAPELLDSYAAERGQVARAVIRQAEVQTRIWLLRRRYEVAARDAALRLASGTRLFHLGYLPWLAGFRTRYGTAMAGSRPQDGCRPGALVPARPVWDEDRRRRLPLRHALDDLRYTLVVHTSGPLDRPTEGLLSWIDAQCADVVDVRVLHRRTRVLGRRRPAVGAGPSRRWRGRDCGLVLVRPDGHVDACVAGDRAELVRRRLAELLRPAGGPAGRIEGTRDGNLIVS